MKATDLRELSGEELAQRHEDVLHELTDLRLKQGRGDAPEQPMLVRTRRRELARIRTVMTEREARKDV